MRTQARGLDEGTLLTGVSSYLCGGLVEKSPPHARLLNCAPWGKGCKRARGLSIAELAQVCSDFAPE